MEDDGISSVRDLFAVRCCMLKSSSSSSSSAAASSGRTPAAFRFSLMASFRRIFSARYFVE